MDADASRALAEVLWRVHRKTADSNGPVVVRELVPREQAESLPHPWTASSDRFFVALADGPHMERFTDATDAQEASARVPRTRLYESVHTRRGEWPALVAALLASWLDSDVLSSVYEAKSNDAGLPEHHDAWHNIVLQLSGSKRWTFGETELVLEPGDVLVVPTGVNHFVRTDDRSTHINFEIIDPVAVAAYMRNSTPVDDDPIAES